MQKPSIVAVGQWWEHVEYPGALRLESVGGPVCLPDDGTNGMDGDLEGHARKPDGSLIQLWNLLTAPNWVYRGDGEQPA